MQKKMMVEDYLKDVGVFDAIIVGETLEGFETIPSYNFNPYTTIDTTKLEETTAVVIINSYNSKYVYQIQSFVIMVDLATLNDNAFDLESYVEEEFELEVYQLME